MHAADRTPAKGAHAHDDFKTWHMVAVTTLTSIATIIGSGILALPVTMYHTSIQVFLVVFTVVLFAEIGTIYAMVELMQRVVIDERRGHSSSARAALVGAEASDNCVPDYSTLSPNASAESVPPSPTPRAQVSLFTIARVYLPNAFLRYAFHIATLGALSALIISYGLAGPQALWQLTHPPPAPSQPPLSLLFSYGLVGSLGVIFFVNFLLPFFSSLTVVKGALFLAVVFIVAALPDAAKTTSMSSLLSEPSRWDTFAVPLLMGTVALGGLANTMPVTFNLLPAGASARQVRHFRNASVLGVVICYVLNIGWVLAVLQVVPRDAAVGKPSLVAAFQNGQISTVPLIETLSGSTRVSSSLLQAVEAIVQLFILVSTVVSFFVVSAGCKSYVDGAIVAAHDTLTRHRVAVPVAAVRAFAYFVTFGWILLTIVTDPDGFISVLTRLSSLSLNVQSGALLFYMLHRSRALAAARQGADEGEEEREEEEAKALRVESGCVDDKVGGRKRGNKVALAMSKALTTGLIAFGGVFFTFVSLLAAFGPMLGIELSAPSE